MTRFLGDYTVDRSTDGDFESIFGQAPDITWAAPGRVNLIGEHTDYNDGFALPIALPMVTTAALRRRGDDQVRVASTAHPGEVVTYAELRPGADESWASYAAGMVWAMRAAGHDAGGLDILLDSDVPIGAGLSSSAALTCAVGGAIGELAGLSTDSDQVRAQLARIAQRAENDYVGAPTGIMDQTASLRCLDRHALLLDARDASITPVPLDLHAEGLALLVIDSQTPHAHVSGEYAQRRRTCEQAAAALGVDSLREVSEADLDSAAVRALDPVSQRRVRHVVTENARVLRTVEQLEAGLLREIGPLLTASHASLRDDYEVSVERVDIAVDAALDAGAYGARITGGGFGGSLIALVDAAATATVRAGVERAYAQRGFTASFFSVVPSPGAHRL